MVVFTCNACGESVKKTHVEKHVNLCRHCQCLSCMDCGQDFWGDDYKHHVKCISEDQKYGGKGYEAKTAKGDVKQQEWIQKVHEAIRKTKINPKVQDVLKQMYTYDNIPRKKIKFQNWMSNSLKIRNSTLQEQVWDIFSEATKKGQMEEKPQDGTGSQPAKSQAVPTPLEGDAVETEEPAKKKNKRERKEERQQLKKTKKSKVQSQPKSFEKPKSQKGKREESESENEEVSQSSSSETVQMQQAELEMNGNGLRAKKPGAKPNAKKRKRSPSEGDGEMVHQQTDNAASEENEEEPQGKFSWKGTIKAVLKQAPDNEISIKKLGKKVVAQYYAVVGDHHHKSEKEVWALFNKKVNSNPKFRVLKEKVKLVR